MLVVYSYSGTGWVIYANKWLPKSSEDLRMIINCAKLIWNRLFIIFQLKTTLLIIIGHRTHSHGLVLFLGRQTVKPERRPYLKRPHSIYKLKRHVQSKGSKTTWSLIGNFIDISAGRLFSSFLLGFSLKGKNFETWKMVSPASRDMVSQV